MAPTATVQPTRDQLGKRQFWLLMGTLMLAMFVSALNQQVVSTAMPKILSDLGGFSMLSWVFTVYMLTSTVVTPLTGKLSDIYGRKPFMIGGIAIFMIGALVSGIAESMLMLITARGIQGVGGGVIMATVFSTLGDLFSPAERGKYMGLFTGTFSLAAVSGPTVGGLLTDHIGWRWCFFINVPVALIAIAAISSNLPSVKRGGPRPKIDFLGAITLSGATTCLLLALVWAQKEFGWSGTETVGLFAATAIFLGMFVVQERRHPEAVMPLYLFKNREFVFANLLVVALGAGGFGAIQYLPTFVQTSLGASATASGLITTPQSLGMLAASVVGGQIVARTGKYKTQSIIGLILTVIATATLTTLHVGEPQWQIAGVMAIVGLGSGLVMPTMSLVIQNSVSPALMGVATSSRQFFMQIGNVLGAAIFGVVLATSYEAAFDSRLAESAKVALPAATYEQFLDPTLQLNERAFAQVKADVAGLPNGDAVLAQAADAQREAVAEAIRHIFLAALGVVVVALLFGFSLRELPLRRGAPSAAQAPKPAPVAPGQALPARER
ncbi:MAG: MDR family MFS transporter [Dehalococcoidia bacterium]